MLVRRLFAPALVALVSVAACQGGPPAPAPAGKAPVAAPAPAEKVAPPAAPQAAAPKPSDPVAAPKPAGPLWPDPLPAGWKLLDDFEKGDPKVNLWGGYAGTWGFRGGKCGIEIVKEDGSSRQKVSWSLPVGDSQCGTLSQFAGPKGKPKPVDIGAYKKVIFLLKSSDGVPHKLHFEITELDPYDAALQGYTGDELVTATPEWQRVEVDLGRTLHPMFDRRKGRQVGLRFDRKEAEASGMVLVDNVAFMP